MDNVAPDFELTKNSSIIRKIKIAQPTGDGIESDNLYSSLQMSQEILGQTVIQFLCHIVGLTHRPISHLDIYENFR